MGQTQALFCHKYSHCFCMWHGSKLVDLTWIRSKPFFLTKTVISFVCDVVANCLKLLRKASAIMVSLRRVGGLGQLVKSFDLQNKGNRLQLSGIWLRLLELTGKHFYCFEHSSQQTFGIWPRIHFSEQRLVHQLQSNITFPKMLRLRCQFENFDNMYLILFSLFNIYFWIQIKTYSKP